jgi:hypothetical protein
LVASTRFTDTAGNNNTLSSTTSITYDTLRPTIALSGCTASYAAGTTCLITITLSDSVSDLVLADFNVTRGSLSGLTTTGTSRTVTYTATGPIAGTSAVSVAAGAITDANGNTNNASNVLNVTVASSNARQLMTSLSASGVSVADNTSGASRYIVQTFAATGSTTWTAPQGVTRVDLLVVGGGGGAGSRGAGGGGAGGYIEASNYTVTPGCWCWWRRRSSRYIRQRRCRKSIEFHIELSRPHCKWRKPRSESWNEREWRCIRNQKWYWRHVLQHCRW